MVLSMYLRTIMYTNYVHNAIPPSNTHQYNLACIGNTITGSWNAELYLNTNQWLMYCHSNISLGGREGGREGGRGEAVLIRQRDIQQVYSSLPLPCSVEIAHTRTHARTHAHTHTHTHVCTCTQMHAHTACSHVML